MLLVFIMRAAENKYVIEVYEYEIKVPTHTIHQPLKSLCIVFQPERRTQKLKQPEWCNYGGLWYIIRVNRNLMVTTHQVHFREY